MASKAEVAPIFVALGPEGTDHHTVVGRFIRFQGLEEIAQIELVKDPIHEASQRVVEGDQKFSVLCAAHPRFHVVNEKYYKNLATVDTFLSPTKDMSIIKRRGVEQPKTIALMEATHGYVDLDQLDKDGITIVPAQSKPVTAQMLIDGECDAGLTFTELALKNPDDFEIMERIGEVDTSWTVFAKKEFGESEEAIDISREFSEAEGIIGTKQPDLYTTARR